MPESGLGAFRSNAARSSLHGVVQARESIPGIDRKAKGHSMSKSEMVEPGFALKEGE